MAAVTKAQLKDVKKGSILEISIKSSYGYGDNKKNLYIVTSRNLVNKGKVDKITMKKTTNLTGVKSYIYIRNDKGYMAVGDSAVSIVTFKII